MFHVALRGEFSRIALSGKGCIQTDIRDREVSPAVCEDLEATLLSAKNSVDLSKAAWAHRLSYRLELPSKLHADFTQPVAFDLVEPGADATHVLEARRSDFRQERQAACR